MVTFARAVEKASGSAGTSFAFMLVAPATNVATVHLLLRQSGGSGGAAPAYRAVSAIVIVSVGMSLAVDALAESGRGGSGPVGTITHAPASSPGLMSGLCGNVMVRWTSFALVCVLALGGFARRRIRAKGKTA